MIILTTLPSPQGQRCLMKRTLLRRPGSPVSEAGTSRDRRWPVAAGAASWRKRRMNECWPLWSWKTGEPRPWQKRDPGLRSEGRGETGRSYLSLSPLRHLLPGSKQRRDLFGRSPGWSGGRERGYPKREATYKLSRRARPSYWPSRVSPTFFLGFVLTSRVLPASEGGPAPSSSSRGRNAATAFVALSWERVEAAILAPAHAGRQRGGTVERRKLQLR